MASAPVTQGGLLSMNDFAAGLMNSWRSGAINIDTWRLNSRVLVIKSQVLSVYFMTDKNYNNSKFMEVAYWGTNTKALYYGNLRAHEETVLQLWQYRDAKLNTVVNGGSLDQYVRPDRPNFQDTPVAFAELRITSPPNRLIQFTGYVYQLIVR